MEAVTRDDLWHEAILEELKGIRSVLSELAELLKTERKSHEESLQK